MSHIKTLHLRFCYLDGKRSIWLLNGINGCLELTLRDRDKTLENRLLEQKKKIRL